MSELKFDGESFSVTQPFMVLNCVSCDVVFGLTKTLIDARQDDNAEFFCPNGHKQCYRAKTRDQLVQDHDLLRNNNKELHNKITALQSQLDQVEAKLGEKNGN